MTGEVGHGPSIAPATAPDRAAPSAMAPTAEACWAPASKCRPVRTQLLAARRPHAVREHPHLRRMGQGAKGRDRASRVTGAITDVTRLPKEAVWVVIERGRSARLVRRRASRGERMIRSDAVDDPRSALHAGRRAPRSSSSRSPTAASSPRGRSGIRRGKLPPLERHAGRSPPPVVGRQDVTDLPQAVQHVERAHLGPRRAGSSPASTPRAR